MTQPNDSKMINPWTGETVERRRDPVTSEQMAEIDRQLAAYEPPVGREEWTKRHGGLYAKYSDKRLSRSGLSRLFRRFLRYELHPYCDTHDITLADILAVGIEQFVVANGWRKVSDVAAWRRNRVRLHVCPSCRDQFVPAMYQANHGLCVHCRKEFSDKAVRGFILRQMAASGAKGEERRTSEPSLLVDFYILFSRNQEFRDLFRKGDPFALDCEAYADQAGKV